MADLNDSYIPRGTKKELAAENKAAEFIAAGLPKPGEKVSSQRPAPKRLPKANCRRDITLPAASPWPVHR